MENTYTYSILKYSHSAFLGEFLNVGLLVYFNKENKFYFKYSSKLSRLKSIYHNVPEKTLKNYLKEINYRVESINKKIDHIFIDEINSSFELFINDYFLPFDGSSLQFEESINSFQYRKNDNEVVEHLKESYLHESSQNKKDKEYEIGKRFYQSVKNYVKEVGKSNKPNFYKDYKVKNTTGAEFNFKYAWQNGSLNLVKPLNFDLSEQRSIARKAHENYGLFVDLESIASKENFRYDLLLIEPTKKELFKEYDHSIKLLEKINRIKLIEETKITTYTKKLITSIS